MNTYYQQTLSFFVKKAGKAYSWFLKQINKHLLGPMTQAMLTYSVIKHSLYYTITLFVVFIQGISGLLQSHNAAYRYEYD